MTRLLIAALGVFLDLAPDLRVLAFTEAIGIFTGLLFGLAPAWRGTRVQPLSAMKANSRGVIEGSKFGLGKWLVVAQVALSLLLIVGAGLMLSTFGRLVSLDPGFDRSCVLLTAVDLRSGNYAPERKRVLYREMLDRLRAIPGVRSVAASALTPICGCDYPAEILIEGSPGQSRADAAVSVNRVTEGYFQTLGIPLVAGRDFNTSDTPASPLVAIVNQNMAAKYFGATNPIGRYYRTRDGHKLGAPVRIVGIVKDSKYGDLRDEFSPVAYLAWRQDAIHWDRNRARPL
jgi:ABC-type antimicrobial peptide transport system permease subunit